MAHALRSRNSSRLIFSLLLLALATAAQAQPTFTKVFSPDTIGVGNATELRFTITNLDPVNPVDDIAFTDVLPAGVTITIAGSPATDCVNAVLVAPDGGGTVSMSSVRLGPGSSCTVTVNVTSTVLGTHTNTSGDLTSDAGTTTGATDDLMVVTSVAEFSKSFAPGSVFPGASSTLGFTIDNSATGRFIVPHFTDNLPAGLVVASPANTVTTCPGSVTAIEGSSIISLGPGILGPGAACTISVDVSPTTPGTFNNVTGELFDSLGPTAGFATAALGSPSQFLLKSFTDDPVSPGGTVTLKFTVTNQDRNFSATDIAFTDNLDDTLSALVALGLPLNTCGGTLSGTSLLSFAGGSLGPGGICTFSVTLQVPGGAAAGTYPNTTNSPTATINGSGVTEPPATANLVVSAAPILTKLFTPNPVAPGDPVTLEFTLTDTSATGSTDIAFTEEVTAALSGMTLAMLPAAGFCGPGAVIFSVAIPPEVVLAISGASLAAGDSCTFLVDMVVPAGAPPGSHLNTTSIVTATVGGVPVSGPAATDTLMVVGGPTLTKDFTNNPVVEGGTATLEFTLTHDATAVGDATGIAFTDVLTTALAGLSATSPPLVDPCGAGSSLTGTTTLDFSGGTLTPGSSCTFSVSVLVPAGAAGGNYANTTTPGTSTVSGLTVSLSSATGTLEVLGPGLTLTKSFTDDPVFPGGMATLELTVFNSSASDATAITFTDDLADILPGLTLGAVPATPCGAGSSLVITDIPPILTVSLTAGNLLAGTSCTFSFPVTVPAGTASGFYTNNTDPGFSILGGVFTPLDPASDDLIVLDPLTMTKSFTDDPVNPGDTVTLEFTITNDDPGMTQTPITFTDILEDTLTGLTATVLPATPCGAGSSMAGTSTLGLSDGVLGPGAFCTFSVTLQVPAGAASGSYPNTTDAPQIGGLPAGLPATDTLVVVALPLFSKSFSPTTIPNAGTSVLTFTIDNTAGATAASSLDFTDDLPAGVAVANPANASTTCTGGTLTATSGAGTITYTGGTAPVAGSCTVQVGVTCFAAGTHLNTTGALGSSAGNSGTASDSLTCLAVPLFSKTFVPDSIPVGPVSTLSFTIDHTANSIDASSLDFTDNLPAGMVIASPANASFTCTGGTLTAGAGTAVVSYTGGTVSAGTSCGIQVDVTCTTGVGGLVNTTGDLTSSEGLSGTASATLTCQAPIPTLGEWGLISLILVLAGLALHRIRLWGLLNRRT